MTTRPEPTVLQGHDSTANTLPHSVKGSALPKLGPASKPSEFPQVIPDVTTHKGRNLVLCFDGTGDEFDKDNSNIVQFFQLLKKDDRWKQLVYYQAGIGTSANKSRIGRIHRNVELVVEQAFATDLAKHVQGGYKFLMQSYTEGDRISLFGFSRGAYTARALAGMIQKVGLLPAFNCEQVKFAYQMFKRDDKEGWDMSNDFKRAFSIDVKIDFIGVFDTVDSVGLIPRQLPFSQSNHLVRVFRHALALDERRVKFKANLWRPATRAQEKQAEPGRKLKYHNSFHIPTGSFAGMRSFVMGEHEHQDIDKKEPEHRKEKSPVAPQEEQFETDVKEVWFSGAHCDVGGGSVPNKMANSLARIPLRWMIRECFLNNTGILFQSAELHRINIEPSTLWPVVKASDQGKSADTAEYSQTNDAKLVDVPSPAPSGHRTKGQVKLAWAEDTKDAKCEIYDQLSIKPWWWILEILPMTERHQPHEGKPWFTRKINLGAPRKIPGHEGADTYVHRSVQYRMQDQDHPYEPRAKILDKPGLVWVD